MSLPARERGSKRVWGRSSSPAPPSLPARERGSKLFSAVTEAGPVRRSPRGSADRNAEATAFRDVTQVAPRAGARIETSRRLLHYRRFLVAPRAGARIETLQLRRGQHARHVAPRAGARIETASLTRC